MRLSEREYRELLSKQRKTQYPVSNTRRPGAVHKDHEKADIQQAYDTAVQTLCDLQSFNGSLFLGRSDFDLQIEIAGGSRADGSNIYKGVEDALNRVAYFDDQQNQHFRKKLC